MILAASVLQVTSSISCKSDQYKCGDLCVSKWWGCECGGVSLLIDSPRYCCVPEGDSCSHDGIDSTYGARNAECSTGHAVDKIEPCSGVCPDNYLPQTNASDNLSCYPEDCPYDEGWYRCGNICLEKKIPCNGTCPDKTLSIQTEADGQLSCYPEDCPYDEGWYWCGDICLKKDTPCICGNETLGYYSRKPCSGVCPDKNRQEIQTNAYCQSSCEYTCSSRSYRCGNLCTYNSWDCTCGDVIIDKESEYCCLSHGSTCSHDGIDSDGDAKDAACSDGQALSKVEPCGGVCPDNYLPRTNASGQLSCYPEDCPYDEGWYWCGNICLEKDTPCICGNETLGYYSRKPCNGVCPNKNRQLLQTNAYGHSSCEYTCSSNSYRCGNLCTYNSWDCTCGDVIIDKESEYCCLSHGDTCSHDGIDSDGDARRAACSDGQALGKVVPCFGVCPDNYLPQTNASGQLSCYLENCPYDEGWYWCGDICFKKDTPCICGSETLGYYSPCNGICLDNSHQVLHTNTAGHSSCEYTCSSSNSYRCGNLCTEKKSDCVCGSKTIDYWNTQHYCCIPNPVMESVRRLLTLIGLKLLVS